MFILKSKVKIAGVLVSIGVCFFIFSHWYYNPKLPPLITSMAIKKQVMQIGDNLSGITWDETTNTLLAVTNNPEQVIQLDRNGNVMTIVPLVEMEDTESISTGFDNTYLIAEERRRKVNIVTISLGERKYKLLSPSFEFDLKGPRNNGIEAVAFSKKNGTMFIANEKKPAEVFKVEGFNTSGQKIKIEKIYSSSKDISGLSWSDTRGKLYILSDEGKSLIEADYNGTILRGSDLRDFSDMIPQPEGVAIHGDIAYVVSEPNFFYAFNLVPNK